MKISDLKNKLSNNSKIVLFNSGVLTQPEDRHVYLKDILESGDTDRLKSYTIDANYYKGGSLKNYLDKKRRQVVLKQSELRLMVKDTPCRVGQFNSGGQGDRVYSPEGKSVALSANGGGRGAKTGLYLVENQEEKSYCIPATYYKENVKSLVTRKKRGLLVTTAPNGKKMIVGGPELQVFKETRTEEGKKSRREARLATGKDTTLRSKDHKQYVGRDADKSNCITTGLGAEGLIAENYTIRKLTPVECARLQCFPDQWASSLSNTRQYKAYGNAVNVEVVRHIFENIKKRVGV